MIVVVGPVFPENCTKKEVQTGSFLVRSYLLDRILCRRGSEATVDRYASVVSRHTVTPSGAVVRSIRCAKLMETFMVLFELRKLGSRDSCRCTARASRIRVHKACR